MAEEYASGGQQISFADQVLTHSVNVSGGVPNSCFINAEGISSSESSAAYIDNSTFEQVPYPQDNMTVPSISFASLPENANQQVLYNTGHSQQFYPEEISQGGPKCGTNESMEALTRSAFELLQDMAANSGNNNNDGASNSVFNRSQFVSLFPSSTSSTSTGIVIGTQSNMVQKVGPGTTILSQAQQPRPNVGTNLNLNKKIIKVISQKPNPGGSTTVSNTANMQKYKRVLVKSSDGSQRNCFVLQPDTFSTTHANAATQKQKNPAPSSTATGAMKLANSVEQEISDMIRITSAEFTIKGEDAKKSGLLEKTAEKDATGGNKSARFFCMFCKERYAQKEGFQYHLQRISFVLKYKCIKCCTVFTFFNKCALWAHLDIHSESIDYERVLRLDPYDFISNPNVFTSDMNASMASSSREIMNKTLSNTQGIEKCPICKEFVRNLPIHLKRPDGKYHAHYCQLCKIYLSNKCSLMAHLRLHRMSEQFLCCPECGFMKQGLSVRDMFDHVDSCMHFNRSESFSCECKATFPSLAETKKHFLETHMKPLSKCSSCSVAFTDPKLLESHLERNPQCKQRSSLTPAKVTCLCTLCKSVMTTAIEAKLHLKKHVFTEPQLSWVCFLCSMMFPTANELRIHCEEDHPHKAKRCTICFMLFCNRQLLVQHILSKNCSRGNHSLACCADMPLKPVIDLDNVVKSLYKTPEISRNQTRVLYASQGSNPIGPSASRPALSSTSLLQENCPQPSGSQKEQGSELEKETVHSNNSSPMPTAPQKQKVAVRKPGSLNQSQSALLSDLQQWISKDGKEIVPTTTPPSKKRGRPKQDKRPPPHLICGVNSKGISYQCHPCKIIVIGTNNFIAHMKYHEDKGDCSYGAFYRCFVCDKLVGSHLITKHLKDHQDQGVIVCCRCQRRDFRDMEEAIQHAHNLCEYKRIGVIAPRPPAESQKSNTLDVSNIELNSPAKETQHSDEGPSDSVPYSTNESTSSTAAPQAKNKLYPCHLCGWVFENVILRDQHVRKSHGGTRKLYHCLVCLKKKVLKTFTHQFTARKHVTIKHRIAQTSLIDKCLKEVVSSVSSSIGQAKVLLSQEQEEVSAEGPAPKKLRLACDGDFMCAKCGFTCPSTDKATFSEHIQIHNPKEEPQCPECGLCFTVLNAVKRHLFAVHKITDVENFLAENGIVEEQEEEEDEFESVLEEMLPGEQPLPRATRQQQAQAGQTGKEQPEDDLDSLECTVCYRSFDTEINLKTHMRTHGMAFIRSKRFKPL